MRPAESRRSQILLVLRDAADRAGAPRVRDAGCSRRDRRLPRRGCPGAPGRDHLDDLLAGRYDVFIDTRLIRSHGPGDHFGELAARDWGGGYGYARLATVRCAEPGRLLKLTTEDLAWLVDSQPAVKARIAATLAERLRNR